MDYRTYAKRLEYLLELIKLGRLQSPYQLVDKFECSERTIRKMINDLRADGYPIKFSRRILRYVIESEDD